jgi:predicted enzyme related to lactoylglutathione lyase
MSLRFVQVNLKAGDDAGLGRFWAEALGWRMSSEGPGVTNLEPEGVEWPDPAGFYLDLVTVPDPRQVAYRAHLDLASTSVEHQAELVDRLSGLGATRADIGQGDVPWVVMADPEGNLFCVLEPREVYRDTGPIAAVVVECADPRGMARFWGEAADVTVHEVGDEFARLRAARGTGPFLEFIRTREPGSRRHRIHIDLLPDPLDARDAEVARIEKLGAVPADVGQGEVSWRVLADPEGNEFCVLGRG